MTYGTWTKNCPSRLPSPTCVSVSLCVLVSAICLRAGSGLPLSVGFDSHSASLLCLPLSFLSGLHLPSQVESDSLTLSFFASRLTLSIALPIPPLQTLLETRHTPLSVIHSQRHSEYRRFASFSPSPPRHSKIRSTRHMSLDSHLGPIATSEVHARPLPWTRTTLEITPLL